MSKQKVLLLGATGETGGDILDGLLEDGNFEVSCLVQPSSTQKPAVKALSDRGFKVVIADLSGPLSDLTAAVTGYDTIISTISAAHQLAQLPLVDAAAAAGCKRFVPCAFTTVCPPHGVMHLRDDKEVVYQRIWYHHLPYTIIDVGYWHQLSWFRVPSGKLDYAMLIDRNDVYAGGEMKTMLTDKRDIGHFVARILHDERTINQKVFTYSDVISQNEIVELIEEKTGERVEINHISAADLATTLAQVQAAAAASTGYDMTRLLRSQAEYNTSKYIRGDNRPEIGKYLGYLDARELYPDFKPITFAQFVDELVKGQAKRPYEDTLFRMMEEARKGGSGK